MLPSCGPPVEGRFESLRKQAEQELKKDPEGHLEIRIGEATRLLHELQVYQTELELQNEELRSTQNELERLNDN